MQPSTAGTAPLTSWRRHKSEGVLLRACRAVGKLLAYWLTHHGEDWSIARNIPHFFADVLLARGFSPSFMCAVIGSGGQTEKHDL